jgi:hypothetical protein
MRQTYNIGGIFMLNFIKDLFKREEPKRDPRVSYAEVSRVPIKKFEPKQFEPKRFNPARTQKNLRLRYTDTDEVVEMLASDAIDEVMGTTRPVVIEGFVE